MEVLSAANKDLIILKLTIPIVIQEVKRVLANSPDSVYQHILANAALRQELTVHVLTKIYCLYGAVEAADPFFKAEKADADRADIQVWLEPFIHEEIQNLLTQHQELESCQSTRGHNSQLVATCWFG